MMQFGCGTTMGRLSATLMILGLALLLAACSSDGGDDMTRVEIPGDNGEPMVTDLGEWNTLMAGSLDISDANDVLRAHYDASGVGHVVAPTPVQPAGTGTATWNGRWSGKIEMNPDPLAVRGLGAYGVSPADLAQLGGGAQRDGFF